MTAAWPVFCEEVGRTVSGHQRAVALGLCSGPARSSWSRGVLRWQTTSQSFIYTRSCTCRCLCALITRCHSVDSFPFHSKPSSYCGLKVCPLHPSMMYVSPAGRAMLGTPWVLVKYLSNEQILTNNRIVPWDVEIWKGVLAVMLSVDLHFILRTWQTPTST